jgi:ribosome-interacting GTPase 1
MPANLTPVYRAAEEEYRQAKDPAERLACLEKMLSVIPKHKGTDKLQGDLKRKISRLKESLQKKSGKRGFSVKVLREGAAQVVLVGAANSGKSALVEVTTNAKTEVADYPISTRLPIPGMFPFENLQFQLVDLPPVNRDYMEPWVTDIIRSADCALWLVDAGDQQIESQVNQVTELLDQRKIRLVGGDAPAGKSHDPIRNIRCILVATKMDLQPAESGLTWLKQRFELGIQVLGLSAMGDSDFTKLARDLFALNRIIRVYSKTPGKETDRSHPHILHQGDRLIDFARMVHKDFAANLRHAKAWGKGLFDGQRIQRDQELGDGFVVELHM